MQQRSKSVMPQGHACKGVVWGVLQRPKVREREISFFHDRLAYNCRGNSFCHSSVVNEFCLQKKPAGAGARVPNTCLQDLSSVRAWHHECRCFPHHWHANTAESPQGAEPASCPFLSLQDFLTLEAGSRGLCPRVSTLRCKPPAQKKFFHTTRGRTR